MRERAHQVAIHLGPVVGAQQAFPLFFRDRMRALLALVPRSGAAWNDATGRDRPINDYRQHCAADVDHYVAQRGRPRWNERLMKFIGRGVGRTEQ